MSRNAAASTRSFQFAGSQEAAYLPELEGRRNKPDHKWLLRGVFGAGEVYSVPLEDIRPIYLVGRVMSEARHERLEKV